MKPYLSTDICIGNPTIATNSTMVDWSAAAVRILRASDAPDLDFPRKPFAKNVEIMLLRCFTCDTCSLLRH
jgi:hypothetical protein